MPTAVVLFSVLLVCSFTSYPFAGRPDVPLPSTFVSVLFLLQGTPPLLLCSPSPYPFSSLHPCHWAVSFVCLTPVPLRCHSSSFLTRRLPLSGPCSKSGAGQAWAWSLGETIQINQYKLWVEIRMHLFCIPSVF